MRSIKPIWPIDYKWYIKDGHYKFMAPERMLQILAEMKKDDHRWWRDHIKLAEIVRVENELKQKVKKVA
jgi:hypothetical protein